jgi:hypothetical protein
MPAVLLVGLSPDVHRRCNDGLVLAPAGPFFVRWVRIDSWRPSSFQAFVDTIAVSSGSIRRSKAALVGCGGSYHA